MSFVQLTEDRIASNEEEVVSKASDIPQVNIL